MIWNTYLSLDLLGSKGKQIERRWELIEILTYP